MIGLRNAEQVQKMRTAGRILGDVLMALRPMVKPGVTTKAIDQAAERMIRDAGAVPSFLGYNGFPASICASVDDQVVHGIPNDTPLREGQLLSVDCGLILDGWQSDSAFTLPVGKASDEVLKLIRVTEECFYKGLEQVREGNRIGDISHAVQTHAESHGYAVIRDLCGHGIGTEMHEDPSIPNFGPAGRGVRLKAGMTICIEPMIAMKGWPVYQLNDGWTVVTRDHGWCSHYEHTILVTDGDPQILSLPGAKLGEEGR